MLVWDDVGTCRAVNKHGASTVVSGGDGYPKKRACNYNELDPQRYAANTNGEPVA